MSITIEGVLDRDAVALVVGRELAAAVRLTVAVGKGLPFEATHVVGTEPAAHINADSLARPMRRGMKFVATADSVDLRADHAERVYVLRGLSAIRVEQWELL